MALFYKGVLNHSFFPHKILHHAYGSDFRLVENEGRYIYKFGMTKLDKQRSNRAKHTCLTVSHAPTRSPSFSCLWFKLHSFFHFNSFIQFFLSSLRFNLILSPKLKSYIYESIEDKNQRKSSKCKVRILI